MNSCSHSGISECNASSRFIVVSFQFGFCVLLAWVSSSSCPDVFSTNSDTGNGKMSLLGTSSLSRIDMSLIVGEEGEDEEKKKDDDDAEEELDKPGPRLERSSLCYK